MTIQTITPSFAERDSIHALAELTTAERKIRKYRYDGSRSQMGYLNSRVNGIQLVFDNDGATYRKSRHLAAQIKAQHGDPYQMQTNYGAVPVGDGLESFTVHAASKAVFTLYTHKTQAWNDIWWHIRSSMETIQRNEAYMQEGGGFDMQHLYPIEKDWLVSHWIEKHLVNGE